MSIKVNIRRIIFVCLWVLAGTGMVVLLIAAVNSRTHQVCRGYEINIKTAKNQNERFIDKNDIVNVLTSNKKLALKNRAIKSFDLNKIESRLAREVWVSDAELFFDNNGILKVNVSERQPVARIFTTSGESFYIDSNCKKLPLSGKASAKLTVFTGYPFSARKTFDGEKKLLKQIRNLSTYLAKDNFWNAQVAQVDITPARDFEIVPTVGNHLIEFGTADSIEAKFRRLMIFYQQVLAKTGMEKYDRIKVQYHQQVIGVKEHDNN